MACHIIPKVLRIKRKKLVDAPLLEIISVFFGPLVLATYPQLKWIYKVVLKNNKPCDAENFILTSFSTRHLVADGTHQTSTESPTCKHLSIRDASASIPS
jgi:hypothetical protein